MISTDISIELAEKSLLGSMLVENYLITDGNVTIEHFTTQQHKSIFMAMSELRAAGKSVDYITLLTVKEALEMGGANYLIDLKNFANTHKFNEYAEILFLNWQQQQKRQILENARSEDWEITKIQNELDHISENVTQHDTNITQDLVELANKPYEEQSATRGVYSGLKDLDIMLNGFQDGELTIIAARPSMGKTDTLNHLAIHAGMAGYKPIIFSLEMKRQTLIGRMVASVGNINRNNLRDPYKTMSDEQKAKWTHAIGVLSNAKIEIDDRPAATVPQIRATSRKVIKQNTDIKPIIFIDYLQIIRANDPKANQTQQVGQISWDLKQMAREFDCPVVCLSQLNRSVEQRADKRPVMSDLRDSGNIEQDADVIAFLYRDEYYNKESQEKNIMEIIIAKHRNGPTGIVKVAFSPGTGRLVNVNWT